MSNPSFRDAEQLSAYLDGKLSQNDSARLEARLELDPNLRAVLKDLTQSRALLRKLPSRRAPRNFTLTPKMAGVKPPLPRAYPALRFATALASVLLIFSFAANTLTPRFAAAPAPAAVYGMGGGGGPEGGVESLGTQAPAATEAPAFQSVPQGNEQIIPTETPEVMSKFAAPQQPPAMDQNQSRTVPASSAPIPVAWEVILLAAALIFGGLTWVLRAVSERSWRAKMK